MFSWAKNILQGWRKLFPIKDCSTKNLTKQTQLYCIATAFGKVFNETVFNPSSSLL